MKHRTHHILFKSLVGFVMMSLIVCISSCQEPDPFPNTPNISFKNLKFVKTVENNTLDSLVLEFDFEDGDGDLGLSSDEFLPPYHDQDYIRDNRGRLIRLNTHIDSVELPLFRHNVYDNTSTFFSDTDNRPSYSCQAYDTATIRVGPNTTIFDTLYVVKNAFRYNLYLKFFWDRGEGGFEELDFEFLTSQFGCGENFNGRFPILDASNIGTSLQGSIKYAMVSSGFEITLRNNPFKIQFYIFDRATNQSNMVETPVYILEDITVLQ